MVAAKYASLIAIVGIYLGVIGYGMSNASVSAAYRAYYIEKKGLPWTVPDGEAYLWGQNISPETSGDAMFADGWTEPEPNRGRRANSDRATIQITSLQRPYAGPVCVILRGELAKDTSSAAQVAVKLNGSAVGVFDIPPGGSFFVHYPGQVDVRHSITVDFATSPTVATPPSTQTSPPAWSLRGVSIENVACRD